MGEDGGSSIIPARIYNKGQVGVGVRSASSAQRRGTVGVMECLPVCAELGGAADRWSPSDEILTCMG